MSQRGLPLRQEIVSSLISYPFSPPSTLLKRPRSKALWEVACRPVGEDTEGWWGEEFPRSAGIERFWLKPHQFHHSFHHPLLLFFIPNAQTVIFFFCAGILPALISHRSHSFFSCRGKNSLMWLRCRNSHGRTCTPLHLILRAIEPWRSHLVEIKTSFLPLKTWDLWLNWLLALKWRNWKAKLVMQVYPLA